MRHPRKEHLVVFHLPVVRTLADMTPEERVAIAKAYRAPILGYTETGHEIVRPRAVRDDRNPPSVSDALRHAACGSDCDE